ncbi:putative drug exporter of the RND superfamily [Nakamurella panacisegetis]|uniref:Putative drug exporter of the RND superfamily n=1 Tax=Nakamurella panacisegetis TaxID=1090615 RepID=A0A1H0HK95_9ACTN|nr:MMPL family transporter [Nakamurella panacisegetis]SDO19629.1 putative drug exporter of the RND superfamily [Nakamurella panacisegetis]
MSTYLYRLSRWCFRKKWAVLAVWLVALIGAGVIASVSGGKTNDAVTIPGTEAQQVVSVLQAKLPAASGASTQVVFAASDGDITDAKYRTAIEAAVTKLAAIKGQVVSATDPFQTSAISPDKHVALGSISYDTVAAEVTTSTLDAVQAAVTGAQAAGVEVEFGGGVYPKAKSAVNSEAIGLLVALIVLLITFGSMVAAGLPVVTALIGVLTTTFAVTALAAVVDIASSATTVATLLGLSCGIDYALFILSRHRSYLLDGLDPEEAAGRAAGTAGGSVVFAGLSVIIALCGLSVVGIPFLTTMGLAAAFTVLIALLISMSLLPAVFGFLGRRAGRVARIPGLRRAGVAARTAVDAPEKLAGTRWANWVVRRRVPVVIIGVIVLGVLCIPIGGMKLGLPGAGSNPTTDTSRRAYDLTTAHFGPGYNGALTVVAENITTAAPAARIASAMGAIPGVASSSVSAVTNGLAIISVVPTTGPNDPATADLVNRIRDQRSTLEGTTGATLLVGGLVATNIDVSAKLLDALPIFVITIVILAFLLLTFAFRTILVPIKSIIGFLLSAGAALGSQVAIFQWGWGAKLIGVEPTETLSFLPVILIAIMFGLSSDYEVFVVSRIKEHFTKTGKAGESVITGTGQSARVVTAAALIMVSIFVSVLLAPEPITKAIGFSFALGVFIDAFIVRLTLVPAVMAIVGGKIWYHPQWFARYVPDPDIEGERLDEKLAQRSEDEKLAAV